MAGWELDERKGSGWEEVDVEKMGLLLDEVQVLNLVDARRAKGPRCAEVSVGQHDLEFPLLIEVRLAAREWPPSRAAAGAWGCCP